MNENKNEGAAKVVLGRFEAAAGQAIGDGQMQVEGGALEVEGHVQETIGTVQEALGQVADKARAAVSRASDAYDRASGLTRDLTQRVEDQPFVAVALAAAAGLLIGLLIAGRGPKVVYVKPRA